MERQGWQNNRFNERIWNELPRKFSLEDIDGVVRFHYLDNGVLKTRFIKYEVKSYLEGAMKPPQLKTLILDEKSTDWSKFDERSGVFIIMGLDENFDRTKILQIKNNKTILIEEEVSFDYYHHWFYNNGEKVKDIETYKTTPCDKCGKAIEAYIDGLGNESVLPCKKCGWTP